MNREPTSYLHRIILAKTRCYDNNNNTHIIYECKVYQIQIDGYSYSQLLREIIISSSSSVDVAMSSLDVAQPENAQDYNIIIIPSDQ